MSNTEDDAEDLAVYGGPWDGKQHRAPAGTQVLLLPCNPSLIEDGDEMHSGDSEAGRELLQRVREAIYNPRFAVYDRSSRDGIPCLEFRCWQDEIR
jgi:hypothetical protein